MLFRILFSTQSTMNITPKLTLKCLWNCQLRSQTSFVHDKVTLEQPYREGTVSLINKLNMDQPNLSQPNMDTNSSDVNASIMVTIMAETTTTATMEQYFGFSFYICVVKCCLSPFILLGNGLTVAIVTRYIKKVTPTPVAVMFLAVADFTVWCLGIIWLPTTQSRQQTLEELVHICYLV